METLGKRLSKDETIRRVPSATYEWGPAFRQTSEPGLWSHEDPPTPGPQDSRRDSLAGVNSHPQFRSWAGTWHFRCLPPP